MRATLLYLMPTSENLARCRDLSPVALAFALAFITASPLHAQYGAVAEVESEPVAGTPLDPTASASQLFPEDDARAQLGLEDLLDTTPGVRVRRSGSWGSFSGLSIRGASLVHTRVRLDRTPLENASGSAFDLSTIPTSALERIEVYRSGAPLSLGGPSMGGVLRLVPRSAAGRRIEAALSWGSFGSGEVRFTGMERSPEDGLHWLGTAGGRTTRGDFTYLDDGGTVLDPSDDHTARRQNAQSTEAWGLAHLELPAGGGRLQLLGWGFQRTGGLSGSALREPRHVRRSNGDYLAHLSWRRELGESPTPRAEVRLGASLSTQRRQLVDRFAELSLVPTATRDWWWQAHAQGEFALRLSAGLQMRLLTEYRRAGIHPEDSLSSETLPNSHQDRWLSGAEVHARSRGRDWLFEGRLQAHVETRAAELFSPRRDLDAQTVPLRWYPSFRASGLYLSALGLGLSASVSNASRAPTLLELFGDRAYLLGDTQLQPERAWTADVGLSFQRSRMQWRARVATRGFYSRFADLIRYVRTAQQRLLPQNVADASILGFELEGSVGAGSFEASGSLTYLASEDRSLQTALPLRPSLQSYAQLRYRVGPWAHQGPLDIALDLTYVGQNYTDRANLVVAPSRLLLGASIGLKLLDSRGELRLSVRDLLNEQPFDYIGFPLPGRRLSVEWIWRERSL